MSPIPYWGGRNTTVINNNVFTGGYRAPYCGGVGFRQFEWGAVPFFNFGGGGCRCNHGGYGGFGGFGMGFNMGAMLGMFSTMFGGMFGQQMGSMGSMGGYNNMYGGMGLDINRNRNEDGQNNRVRENDNSNKQVSKAKQDDAKFKSELEALGLDASKCQMMKDKDGNIFYKYDGKIYSSLKDINPQETPADAVAPDTIPAPVAPAPAAEKPPSTIADILKKAGITDATAEQEAYLQNHISDVVVGEDGSIRYNITAVTHDTDLIDTIKNRFYKAGETPDLQVGTANFSRIKSETEKIIDPHSGNKIVANGVSEHGIKALYEDAKSNITSNGEITKTNKRIARIKSDFESGKDKISWAYVSQNKLYSRYAYDKIIGSKYSN